MKSLALFSIVLFTACGDDKPQTETPDAPMHDIDAAPPAKPRAVVVAGDFTPGNPGVLSAIDLETKTVSKNAAPAGAVGSDPLLRKFGEELFVVNRNDANITILKASDFSLVEQLSTGANSNPQDVAVIGNKLYVPTFGGKGVVVLTRGSTTSTEIDLSADDPDGKPKCESIFVAGGKLYVACGLLDDTMMFLPPRGNGKIYVIANDAKSGTINATTKNPLGLIEQDAMVLNGDLLVPTIDFSNNEGCIERIDPTKTTTACAIENSVLGGFVNRIAMGSDHTLYASVSGNFPDANLQKITGTTAMTVSPIAQHITDAVGCPEGTIAVADQTTGAAGVRLYKASGEVTTAALDVGLPPKSSHGLVCY